MATTRTSAPLIGVTTRHGDAAWVEKNTINYLNTLADLGAEAQILSPDASATLPDGTTFQPDDAGRLPAAVLDHLDGLILSGGGDVDPAYFGAELDGAIPENIDRKRDELELGLAQAALVSDLPVFGICRGCQVLNVAAGGGMVQHFEGHSSPKQNPVFHDVTIQPDTRFSELIGERTLSVNTYHHQGLDARTLAAGFRPSAFADPDAWLIEAYESADHRWVIGVQWHSERLFELGKGHRRIWQSFLAACRAESIP